MAPADRLTEAHQRLTHAVEAIASGSDWRRMLEVAGQFHTYSTSNVLLILAQRPDATRVAGYRTWQRMGRQVRRGEKGIMILAPVVYRRRPVDQHDETEQPELARILRGFTVVHVWDQAQTSGEPLPEVRPILLDGDNDVGLWDRMARRVAAAGFGLERGPCREANGLTDYARRVVRVRDDLHDLQAAKTLAHELAHVLLHDRTEYAPGCRGRAEVEAESVAFLITAAFEVDAGDYVRLRGPPVRRRHRSRTRHRRTGHHLRSQYPRRPRLADQQRTRCLGRKPVTPVRQAGATTAPLKALHPAHSVMIGADAPATSVANSATRCQVSTLNTSRSSPQDSRRRNPQA
jgi:hypothetical protein